MYIYTKLITTRGLQSHAFTRILGPECLVNVNVVG